MPGLRKNLLVKQMLSLGLPADDFAVFGGGPLMARGIRESRDLDLIARNQAWTRAESDGEEKISSLGDRCFSFFGGRIEVFDRWAPGEWDIDELIDTADILEGIRFVRLDKVIEWKRRMGRPKDLRDIGLIEDWLARQA